MGASKRPWKLYEKLEKLLEGYGNFQKTRQVFKRPEILLEDFRKLSRSFYKTLKDLECSRRFYKYMSGTSLPFSNKFQEEH